ncbi:craniofacial development protein 2-like [Heterodontus francisci]|uniref:craniofacial development protein 2-like n=1 Tax=Heterodontus francisci TaxID=7792 RepID=UPI00355B3473
MCHLWHVSGSSCSHTGAKKVDCNTAPNSTTKKGKRIPAFRFASWNVRTMCPGLSEDLTQFNDSRKTAIINNKLSRLDVDIAALQETRLPASGSLREQGYTFFWQGRDPEEPRQHGVGFAIRNSLLSMIEPPSNGSERILSIRLFTASGLVHLLSIYAPTLCSPHEDKDQSYEELHNIISSIPNTEHLFLLGDFNARVGADHDSWLSCLGRFGIGRMNENGQRLLELCTYHNLCITNSFFHTKPCHQVSWRHPRSRHWHQLDLIVTRQASLNSVQITRSFCSGAAQWRSG